MSRLSTVTKFIVWIFAVSLWSSIVSAQMIPIANWNDFPALDIGVRAQMTGVSACSATSVTLTKPTGTVANDVLFAQVWASNNTGARTITPPAGWQTLRYDDESNGTWTVRQYIFYKVAGGSEGANYTFTWSGSSCGGGGIVGYYNVKTSAPVDTSACNASHTVAPATAPSINLTKKKVRVLYTYLDAWAETINTMWAFTRELQHSPSPTSGLFLQDRTQATAGATGTAEANMSSGNPTASCQIALKPSGSISLRSVGMSTTGSYDNSDAMEVLTLTKPTGVVSGDIILTRITLFRQGDVPAQTYSSSGWTVLRSDRVFDGWNTMTHYWLYKIAGGAEPSSYTFTPSAGSGVLLQNEGLIFAYSGVDNAAPINAHDCSLVANGWSSVAPSITTTVANAQVIYSLTSGLSYDFAPPRAQLFPLTKRWENADAGNSQTVMGADAQRISTGSTGNMDFPTTAGNQWVACQIGIRPGP